MSSIELIVCGGAEVQASLFQDAISPHGRHGKHHTSHARAHVNQIRRTHTLQKIEEDSTPLTARFSLFGKIVKEEIQQHCVDRSRWILS
jgi:hypothetical protein